MSMATSPAVTTTRNTPTAETAAVPSRTRMIVILGALVALGPLTIDTARRLVFVDGDRADLTKREFDLLAVLAENAGVVLSRQRLLELVWGYDFDVDTNVADVFVSYLRRKLERDGHPRVIHTVRGIGYRLVAPA